jgi:membrane protein DedA with SNARE-associated domain/rhodanese-related sulfurtransferase
MLNMMEEVTRHGYGLLFAAIFLECIGFPIPASIALLGVGAACAHHLLHPTTALVIAVAASLIADTLLYLAGRKTGWWLLSMLCRVSVNPETCILRSADSFYKRGSKTLLFSKFIPGINSLAAPLAGSMSMRMSTFLRFDSLGALFYCGGWLAVGYLFSDVVSLIASTITRAGHFVLVAIIILIIGYICYHAYLWYGARRYLAVDRVSPMKLKELLQEPEAGRNILVADCRSHGYYDSGARRIKGSIRLEPNLLPNGADTLPPDCEIYLYCTCIRETTSSRVAWMCAQQGLKVHVIEGGLRAWTKADLPTEQVPAEDVVMLPRFD